MLGIGYLVVNTSKKFTESRDKVFNLSSASKMILSCELFLSQILSDCARKCTFRQRRIISSSRSKRQHVAARIYMQSISIFLYDYLISQDQDLDLDWSCSRKLPHEAMMLFVYFDSMMPISLLEARMFIQHQSGLKVAHLLYIETVSCFQSFTELLSFMYYTAFSNTQLFSHVGIPSKALHSLILLIDSQVVFFGFLALMTAKQNLFKCLLNISINNNHKKITICILIDNTTHLCLPFVCQNLYLFVIIIMSEMEGRSISADQYSELLAKKAYYEELLCKNQSLPIIIQEKRKIVETLTNSNTQLLHKITFSKDELTELQNRLEEFQRLESLVSKLQEKEREMESQYEDYQQLTNKLDRQIKLLQQESQILKGKAIIEYNKISEVREESAAQTKQRQILEKHHEEMKKKEEVLKKKVKNLKQEHKKRNSHRHKIEETDLQREVKQLKSEHQYCKKELEDLIKSKSNYISQEEYQEIIQELKALKEENQGYEQELQLNHKLKKERNDLQNRINFLSNVDSEFINQKKLGLIELSQKVALYEAQRQSEAQHLAMKQEKLAEYMHKYPDFQGQPKKPIKKRRQPKQRPSKKPRQIHQQPLSPEVVQKRPFRCHKIKRIIFSLMLIFMIFGLVIDRYYAI